MEDWPLSAAATDLLRRRVRDRSDLLKLALKELVVSGSWRLSKVGGPLGSTRTLLLPTRKVVSERQPFPVLSERLKLLSPRGGEIAKVVRKAGRDLSRLVHDDCRDELARRGLVVVPRGRLLGVGPRRPLRRTPLGDQWTADFGQQQQVFVEVLRAQPSRGLRAAADVPAPLLLADKTTRREIDRAVERARGADGGVPGTSGGYDVDTRLHDIDQRVFDDLGTLDRGIDHGVDYGGGGDGGGGDGGGGGGD